MFLVCAYASFVTNFWCSNYYYICLNHNLLYPSENMDLHEIWICFNLFVAIQNSQFNFFSSK